MEPRCSKCGAELQEGRDRCPLCGESAKPPLWRRFLGWFSAPGNSSSINIPMLQLKFGDAPKHFTLAGSETVRVKGDTSDAIIHSEFQELSTTQQSALEGRDAQAVIRQLPETFQEQIRGRKTVSLTLDDLPPDIREKISAGLQSGSGSPVETAASYTFRDSSGQEHTYHSIEEMPPDIRALFAQARGRLPKPGSP